ncbi:unnamed protein product [Lupinus luteus]|uniref:Uncharacterized protein n=1 Tax=Lupinus luteus TaxID=3873 RepID=A0AAV1XU07_LUPLU
MPTGIALVIDPEGKEYGTVLGASDALLVLESDEETSAVEMTETAARLLEILLNHVKDQRNRSYQVNYLAIIISVNLVFTVECV